MAKKSTPVKAMDKFSMQDIKDLISILRRNNIWEFDLEQNGIKLHIVTGQSDKAKARDDGQSSNSVGGFPTTAYPSLVSVTAAPPTATPYPHPPATPPAPKTSSTEPSTDAAEQKPESAEPEQLDENLIIIQSPMVGTFYRAPAPDAPPYVDIGDLVKDGQVLCIIEAMKLMNEIKCECGGKIVKILVENGQPVEYGQHLFLVEPA